MEDRENITCTQCNGPGRLCYMGTICSVECLVRYAEKAGRRETMRVMQRVADAALSRVRHNTMEQCIQSINWAADKQG